MYNQELESVDAAKYLGMAISKDMCWNTHINNNTSTANETLGFVKRNVITKNKDIKTKAYNSLVRLQVEYKSADGSFRSSLFRRHDPPQWNERGNHNNKQ